MIATGSYSSALALDAADGVIDGAFLGAPIGIARSGIASSSLSYVPAAGSSLSSLSYAPAISTLTAAAPAISTLAIPTTAMPAFSAGFSAPSVGYTTSSFAPAISPACYSPMCYAASIPTTYSAPIVSAPSIASSCYQCAAPVAYTAPAPVSYAASAPVSYVASAPEIRVIHKQAAAVEESRDSALAARVAALEVEAASLRTRLSVKSESSAEVHTSTKTTETYKVKDFETAAKLSVMDGTDDGLYNGLAIEVEGLGLYRDLVAKGWRASKAIGSLTGSRSGSVTRSETYKVATYELAEKLSRMDGRDDGKYNGIPIEVAGQGLYTDLVKTRRGYR